MPLTRDRITVVMGMPELEALKVEENEKEVRIWAKRWADCACCPKCGQASDKVHSFWEAKIRDLAMFGKRTTLVIRKRRFRCLNGCRPFLEWIHGLERYQRQTKRYGEHLEMACRSSSLASASRKENIGYKILDRLYYEKAGAKAADFTMQALPSVMGIDEFSGKKGVRMHMGITDLSGTPRLWDVMEKKECVAFMDYFDRYSLEERSQVNVIVHDMDLGIDRWSEIMFRRALHVIDKFHLARTLLKHLERVRKVAYAKAQSEVNKKKIRSAYFLIWRRKDKMSEKEKARLEELFAISPSLKEACEFKEAFMEWYDKPKRRPQAESELRRLYQWLKRIPHLNRFSWALTKWWDKILNYFALTYSNGFTEGMNNKIKTLKRVGYGFRNFDRFRVRILNECVLR